MRRTQFNKMYLLLLLSMLMWASMAAAQSRCDPLTQYEKNGQCCKMCGPGTRMSTVGTCEDPQCTDCGDNDYQDKYTTDTKCTPQPYCDPHKNFQVHVNKNKKEKSACMCKEGFHCSSAVCITCVPHTTCKQGYGAKTTGSHARDTKCEECKEGTFSDEISWNGVCKEWSECRDGYHVKQKGTNTTDSVCEKNQRKHVVICLVTLVIVTLAAISLTYWFCKGDAKEKVCVESCLGEQKEQLTETRVPIMHPTGPIEEESMFSEMRSSQEEGCSGPEENEHQPNQEASAAGRTEGGNFLAQENGKSVVISRQESQTQSFIDLAESV
ncbi:tumor necrosis factor receptor superfamily member 5 isoform X2 [Plectropomus leopardus]|uniref:tumor necrosis factor receptor superfamily member 5 isoform X2 n=1 Tax=Plectropomus leopardus TaxID=160734 RepID=UPI001C4AECB3|nr:tumor necrosis factor receptor superfamily member 5 isoform X2 [Plectropomus leopardus]